jgi:predicted lipid-binding transport protein (Tim44 family)
MTLRDVQHAQVTRDAGGLRDRLVPAMYAELEARCDRLRTSGRWARPGEMEVRAEVTEAWQDGDRDYLTAYVAGSMLGRTAGDPPGASPSAATPVAAFLTFTRPAGLNFWMLSLIQGEVGIGECP